MKNQVHEDVANGEVKGKTEDSSARHPMRRADAGKEHPRRNTGVHVQLLDNGETTNIKGSAVTQERGGGHPVMQKASHFVVRDGGIHKSTPVRTRRQDVCRGVI